MPSGFVSRAQMGFMWRNKRELYEKKLMPTGNIAQLPWRVSSTKLNASQRVTIKNARQMLAAGKITQKGFEKIFRDSFPLTHKPTRAERMAKGLPVPKLGRRLGAKDRKPRKRRKRL